jgi:hypothetical protein
MWNTYTLSNKYTCTHKHGQGITRHVPACWKGTRHSPPQDFHVFHLASFKLFYHHETYTVILTHHLLSLNICDPYTFAHSIFYACMLSCYMHTALVRAGECINIRNILNRPRVCIQMSASEAFSILLPLRPPSCNYPPSQI